MKTVGRLVLLLVLLGIALAAGFRLGRQHSGEGATTEDETVPTAGEPAAKKKLLATVISTPLKRATITETITAYGSVVAPGGNVRILSVPFESRVVKVLVSAGQLASAGAEVIRLEPSPETATAVTEAQNALAAAERELQQTRQRFADRLATNTELSQAEQAIQSAKLKLDSLVSRGANQRPTLKADADGIVSKVDVQDGQIVPAGGALVEIAAGKGIEVALGVEPADAPALKPGQPVELTLVGATDAAPIAGAIRLIGQRVDPATRMASVLVTLPADTHWMLDAYVVGRIVKASAEALVVPRDAVLTEEDGSHVLYTVQNGHAKKHAVRVGIENDRETQVIADELKEGDAVISTGNYEVEDGMEVTATPAPAATSAPTSAPAPSTQEDGK